MASFRRMARSSHGLDRSDDGWWTRGLCRGKDPSWWVTGEGLSKRNEQALAFCDACPVRAECLNDYLRSDIRPKSIIAGGWRWNAKGEATPHRDDQHLTVEPVPRERTGARVERSAAAAQRLVTAGRRILAGAPIDEVSAQTGLARTTLYDATRIVRRASPDLLARFEAGQVSVYACRLAIRRQAGTRRAAA